MIEFNMLATTSSRQPKIFPYWIIWSARDFDGDSASWVTSNASVVKMAGTIEPIKKYINPKMDIF
jgi:hypothetical protein